MQAMRAMKTMFSTQAKLRTSSYTYVYGNVRLWRGVGNIVCMARIVCKKVHLLRGNLVHLWSILTANSTFSHTENPRRPTAMQACEPTS